MKYKVSCLKRRLDYNNLLRCPFCGGQAFISVYYPNTDREYLCIECSWCGIQSAKENLIKFWNTRYSE